MKEQETLEHNQNWQIMPKIYLPFGTLQCEEQKGLFVLRGKLKIADIFAILALKLSKMRTLGLCELTVKCCFPDTSCPL